MDLSPRIFIGSSDEAYKKSLPQTLQIELSNWSYPKTWKTIFNIGETTIESLVNKLPDFDAYVFILTGDDLYTTRNKTYVSARDNILFEMGLAIGLKGRENTFIINQKIENGPTEIKLPSDILGTTYGEFTYRDPKDMSPTEMDIGIDPNDMEKVMAATLKAQFETISNRIKDQYFEHHKASVDALAEKKYAEKVTDLSQEIGRPIQKIRETIEEIGKTLENEIAVLSGAQKCGIVNIFPNRYDKIAGGSLNESIAKEFMTTQSSIFIQGISLGDYFLDRGVMHKHFMRLISRQLSESIDDNEDTLEAGLHIQALIVDPKCKALIERSYWEAGPEYCQDLDAYTDSTTYIETDGAARIAHRLQNKFSSLEVRCYTQAPTCFLLLTGKYAFVENYTYASRGSSCPNIQIEEGTDLYKLYKKHFQNIWDSATPIEQYDPMRSLDPELFSSYSRHCK